MAPFQSRGAGYALLAFCAASFVTLAALVVTAEGFLLQADRPIRVWAIDQRAGPLNTVMVGISWLGSRWVIGPLLLVLAGWMFATGRCRIIATVMIVAAVLNPVIEFILKEVVVQRMRPEGAQLVAGRGAAFPSGHVLATVGFYGMLPVLVAKATRQFTARAAAFAGAGLVILAVGFSRIYLGVHWFTDVLGGLLLATVVVLGTYEALGGHRLDEKACAPDRPFRIGQRWREPSNLVR